jgi:hypothetical protein
MSDCSHRWEPVTGIEAPCAFFTFAAGATRSVSVTLHFQGLLPQDLRLVFKGMLALAVCPDWVSIAPAEPFKPLPRCGGRWPSLVFPLVRYEPSSWLASNAPEWSGTSRELVHFAVFTEIESLHIAALPQVDATWIAPMILEEAPDS